jgi:cytoskeletal protein CcmA (bactofilin family)
MFASKKSDGAPNDREIRAFLEEGCEFEGRLSFTGVVRLNGKFRGDIESEDTLIIGDTAQVEGKLTVGAIIVGGHVIGAWPRGTSRERWNRLSTSPMKARASWRN